jgi:hypothetical protein
VTPIREAFALPGLFLTVVLAGSVEVGSPLRFVPPPLFALVLALMLVAALTQCGALRPDALLAAQRSALENLNGLAVILTLFAASAQALAVVLPASGVPEVLMGVLLFALLAQALAIGADRTRMLRGLMVSFALAFVLKFIVLASLSAPAEGRLARAVQLLFEGVTLGSITQAPLPPAAGYLAFATLLLYLFGLVLLPRPGRRPWATGELIDDRSSQALRQR